MSSKKKSDPIVCHCLKITESQLKEAIRSHKITSVEDVTKHTQAGDGCTACLPFLTKLLNDNETDHFPSPPSII